MGVHSNIGGGYFQGEQGKQNDIAFLTLNWMIDTANTMVTEYNFGQPVFASARQQPTSEFTQLYGQYEQLRDIYNQNPTLLNGVNLQLTTSIIEDRYVNDPVRWYHPGHVSFGSRDTYYPNDNLNNNSSTSNVANSANGSLSDMINFDLVTQNNIVNAIDDSTWSSLELISQP